ncbi:MAG: hypothetical protein NVS9B15_16210 [Acidobacteriaceae bacterium]
MLSADTLYLPIREMATLIHSRKISPVELTQSYLERSHRLGPSLNAYATITDELALRQAHEAEREIMAGGYRGLLHGIPYAAKDLVAVRGYPTTWGATPYRDQRFDFDATVIERLNRAGAILIGKAAMIELAGGLGYEGASASLTGPAKNPWDTSRWTCGSSSGSGAIVSAALAPWALGSDTRGSILCPTAWCGISGMRPSFGRVSRYGAMAISWTMDKLGPMCRTADDCGIVLSTLAGHDPNDHDSLPAGVAEYRHSDSVRLEKPLRIGKLTNCWNKLEDGLERAVNDVLGILKKQGASISEAEFPSGPYEEVAELTILIEAASAFQDLLTSGRCAELADPHGQVNGYASQEFSAVDYLHIQRARTILQQRVNLLFNRFDVLVTAGQSSTASDIAAQEPKTPPEEEKQEAIEQRAPDGVSSLCGLPAVAVPCGLSREKLPFSVQFIGEALADKVVLDAARLFQRHSEWHKMRPPTSG